MQRSRKGVNGETPLGRNPCPAPLVPLLLAIPEECDDRIRSCRRPNTHPRPCRQSGADQRLVGETASHFGRLDGLIDNAGGMLGRIPTSADTNEHYEAVMDLNARSVLVATRANVPYLKKQGGFIIHTTSVAARNGGGGGAVLHAASKGFVSTLTHGQAKELIGDRIRVNAVAPGVIATPFH